MQQHEYAQIENTIDFQQAKKPQPRHIELRPKTLGQEQLVLSLTDPSVFVTVAIGPAGTGKSYLAMLAALQALRTGRCQRVILTRPAVTVEDEQHGFLPGDLISKMEPWTRPLLDIMKEFYRPKEILEMLKDEVIEISPLAFMRQIKMLLTRIGDNSRIVVTGDVEQTDRTVSNNGLIDLCQRLKRDRVDGLSLCELTSRDVQRHHIITKVLKMYAN